MIYEPTCPHPLGGIREGKRVSANHNDISKIKCRKMIRRRTNQHVLNCGISASELLAIAGVGKGSIQAKILRS